MHPIPTLACAEEAYLNRYASGDLQADPRITRHDLRSGSFAFSGEDTAALAALQRCVEADWCPRDAYERHWVGEVTAALWRANRLRRLEVEHLDAVLADPDLALAEATVKKLIAYARYGARLDADLKRALGALRVLKERPDERVAAGVAVSDGSSVSDDTDEPDAPKDTSEPDAAACAREPAPRHDRGKPKPSAMPETSAAPRLNRKARRRQQALLRKTQR